MTVYFMQGSDTGRIKIGFSDNVVQRFAQLRAGTSGRLGVIGYMPGGLGLEAKLHRVFLPWHYKCEWFKPDILGSIELMLKSGILQPPYGYSTQFVPLKKLKTLVYVEPSERLAYKKPQPPASIARWQAYDYKMRGVWRSNAQRRQDAHDHLIASAKAYDIVKAITKRVFEDDDLD